MSSFWRGLFKFQFRISFAFGIIVSVVLGALIIIISLKNSETEENYMWILGILIIIGGIIFTISLHALCGMLLEFLDNVAVIKKRVCIAIEDIEDENAYIEAMSSWKCTYCKGKNPPDTVFCIKCGRPKVAPVDETQPVSQTVEVPKDWLCAFCRVKNASDSLFCMNCGKPKG